MASPINDDFVKYLAEYFGDPEEMMQVIGGSVVTPPTQPDVSAAINSLRPVNVGSGGGKGITPVGAINPPPAGGIPSLGQLLVGK